MSALIALAAGLIAICLLTLLRWQSARSRKKRFKGLELRPNCLLTRYPIIFLSKPKSLLRPFDAWRDVPLFLREHGYEVLILTPVRNAAFQSVHAALKDLDSKCHLIAGRSERALLEGIAEARLDNVASLTVVQRSSETGSQNSLHVDDLRPARQAIETFELRDRPREPWQFEARFLDYAISLAERDAGWCDL